MSIMACQRIETWVCFICNNWNHLLSPSFNLLGLLNLYYGQWTKKATAIQDIKYLTRKSFKAIQLFSHIITEFIYSSYKKTYLFHVKYPVQNHRLHISFLPPHWCGSVASNNKCLTTLQILITGWRQIPPYLNKVKFPPLQCNA